MSCIEGYVSKFFACERDRGHEAYPRVILLYGHFPLYAKVFRSFHGCSLGLDRLCRVIMTDIHGACLKTK